MKGDISEEEHVCVIKRRWKGRILVVNQSLIEYVVVLTSGWKENIEASDEGVRWKKTDNGFLYY